jgi:hypothetical protein
MVSKSYIRIYLKSPTEEIIYNLPIDMKFYHIIDSHNERLNRTNIYYFKDFLIDREDTALSLGLKDEDTIDVVKLT